MYRGTWRVHGVMKSRTRLTDTFTWDTLQNLEGLEVSPLQNPSWAFRGERNLKGY